MKNYKNPDNLIDETNHELYHADGITEENEDERMRKAEAKMNYFDAITLIRKEKFVDASKLLHEIEDYRLETCKHLFVCYTSFDLADVDKAVYYLEKSLEALDKDEVSFLTGHSMEFIHLLMNMDRYEDALNYACIIDEVFDEYTRNNDVSELRRVFAQFADELEKATDEIYHNLLLFSDEPKDLRKEALAYYLEYEDELENAKELIFNYYASEEKLSDNHIKYAVKCCESDNVDALILMLGLNVGTIKTDSYKANIDNAEGYYLKLKDLYARHKLTFAEQKMFLEYEKAYKLILNPEKHFGFKHAADLLNESLKRRDKSLIIPDGYTHIDKDAFNHFVNADIRQKDQLCFKELIIPDSVVSIGDNALRGFSNLTKIRLSNRLVKLGDNVFDGTQVGMFNRIIEDKRVIERILIPNTFEYSLPKVKAFRSIHTINELIYDEGIEWVDLSFLQENYINFLYVPDSAKRVVDYSDKYFKTFIRIKMVSLPARFKDKVPEVLKKRVDKIVFR